MATAPLLSVDGRDDANVFALSGKVPKVCSTGILSTKASLRFSHQRILGEIEREQLYRGRLDISAIRFKVNQNLKTSSD